MESIKELLEVFEEYKGQDVEIEEQDISERVRTYM